MDNQETTPECVGAVGSKETRRSLARGAASSSTEFSAESSNDLSAPLSDVQDGVSRGGEASSQGVPSRSGPPTEPAVGGFDTPMRDTHSRKQPQTSNEPSKVQSRWTLRTLKDAHQPHPPAQYVVEGLFKLPSLNLVVGPAGSLKSMLLMDCAVAVAAGELWLPLLIDGEGTGFQTERVSVLWCDFDMGRDECDERFKAFSQARNILPDDPDVQLRYVSSPEAPPDLSDEKSVAALEELIEEAGAKLVFLDNLGVMSAAVDENSNRTTALMGRLRGIAERCRVAIVVIHHTRKEKSDSALGQNSIRGHSSIAAAVDCALTVSRIGKSDEVRLSGAKARRTAIEDFCAHLTFKSQLDTTLEHACFNSVPGTGALKTIGIETSILDVLREYGELNQGELAKKGAKPGKISEKAVVATAERMVVEGKLVSRKGPRNATLYSLPEGMQSAVSVVM